jgi:hypothetical protein
MRFTKVIQQKLSAHRDGDAVDAVNAVVAVNVGGSSSKTFVSSRQVIVQRDGDTEVFESEVTKEGVDRG